ncbi:hypothetical protein ACFYO0_13540 [Streptomyces sp. NPDC006365]|uniref:hypothetical protein n=1 Tax=Streptomyces sp. NPDC006365 TaxID=3364744 RepID=UPI0036ABB0B5
MPITSYSGCEVSGPVGSGWAASVPAFASRRYGATGVPFFVLDRAHGLSGAKPADTFLSALRTAHADAAPATR